MHKANQAWKCFQWYGLKVLMKFIFEAVGQFVEYSFKMKKRKYF